MENVPAGTAAGNISVVNDGTDTTLHLIIILVVIWSICISSNAIVILQADCSMDLS